TNMPLGQTQRSFALRKHSQLNASHSAELRLSMSMHIQEEELCSRIGQVSYGLRSQGEVFGKNRISRHIAELKMVIVTAVGRKEYQFEPVSFYLAGVGDFQFEDFQLPKGGRGMVQVELGIQRLKIVHLNIPLEMPHRMSAAGGSHGGISNHNVRRTFAVQPTGAIRRARRI